MEFRNMTRNEKHRNVETNACLKDFRYGANVDFWLGAMGQIPILAMGQTLKIIRIFNHNGRYEG